MRFMTHVRRNLPSRRYPVISHNLGLCVKMVDAIFLSHLELNTVARGVVRAQNDARRRGYR